jgi:hypothetical protein
MRSQYGEGWKLLDELLGVRFYGNDLEQKWRTWWATHRNEDQRMIQLMRVKVRMKRLHLIWDEWKSVKQGAYWSVKNSNEIDQLRYLIAYNDGEYDDRREVWQAKIAAEDARLESERCKKVESSKKALEGKLGCNIDEIDKE